MELGRKAFQLLSEMLEAPTVERLSGRHILQPVEFVVSKSVNQPAACDDGTMARNGFC